MRSLADFTYLRSVPVLVAATVALLAALPFALGVFDQVESFDISDPESEVERAYRAYERATGQNPEAEIVLLVEPTDPKRVGPLLTAAEAAAERLQRLQGVAAVRAPRSKRDPLVSIDGDAALVLGFLGANGDRVEAGGMVVAEFADESAVTAGGTAVAAYQIGEQSEDDTRRIELLAAPLLLLLCLAVFRSAIAALLPVALAAFSILITFAVLNGIARLADIDLFSLQVVTGLGVGLAIDYSLFVLARYRSELRRGIAPQDAQRVTLATAGRTVAFSALTVAAALAALILFPNQFLSSTGAAGALVALMSGVAALLVLPAALAVLGPRIDPGFAAAPDPASAPPDPLTGGRAFWTALSRRVMARPLPVAALAVLVMLLIASPALDGRLSTPDARVLPKGESARKVADTTAERFENLPTTTLTVVIPPVSDRDQIKGISAMFEAGGQTRALGPRSLDNGSEAVLITAPIDPLSEDGQDLLADVRGAGWPEGTLVGGRAAELNDQRSSISDTAPLVVAVVVVANFLLVLLLVRSVVLPLVAVLLNSLTVLAAYGVMVVLFENEGPARLLGTVAQDGIDISVPILAFAVVFGLSTDYGIFLFSRIAEAREDGMSDDDAVVEGVSRTGRLITVAAVIFSIAVGAFAFSDLVIVKEFAVAVAVAVVLDATIVRMLLVPAILGILGSRAWAQDFAQR